MTKQWFAVHTQPSKEKLAAEHLLRQSFETYLPLYKKIRRHARKIDVVSAPLFPRYLFVHLDTELDRWRSINGTRGVSYLLTYNERPAIVPDKVIQDLKLQMDPEGIVPLQSLVLFLKGDSVRVTEGAFVDQSGVFEKMDGSDRVQILLNFMGRQSSIKLPLYAIEAA